MSRNIYRLLKILHLIGLSLFLGSIFSHIVASVLGGAPQAGNEAAFLASRVHITAATRYLTMPSLLLTLATGMGMWLQSWSLKRDVWLRVHMCCGADCSVGIFCDCACGRRNVAVGAAGRGGTRRANQGGAQGGRYSRRGQYPAGGAGDGLGCG